MWGVFPGIALGIFQFVVTRQFALVMTRNKVKHKKWVVILTICKYLVLLSALILMSLISASHLFWAAGGMIGSSILLAVVQYYKNSRA